MTTQAPIAPTAQAPTTNPEQRAHALLSASSAERWLHCTPSARLEDGLPDKTSSYAEEGRLAHALAELKVRKKFTPMKKSDFEKQLKKVQTDSLYQEEMQGYTDEYVDYVAEAAMRYQSRPYIALEVRVNYSHIAPEGFGTADCILIGGDTLTIIDFKYGKGVPVFADENPQMRLYALGALKVYAPIYGDTIKNIRMAIVQPRLEKILETALSVSDLNTWGESVKPVAVKAFNGGGEQVPGEWCRFCAVRATCRARASEHTALEDFKFILPPQLTDAEVGEILIRAQNLATWVSDLEEYALKAILDGKSIPGWKAVEGRSNRTYTDKDAALQALVTAGYDKAIIQTTPELLGITALEKVIGKKEFAAKLGGYIYKPPGKPTLALESDNRAVYSSAAADFKDVVNQ
jgi:hypothetical protein